MRDTLHERVLTKGPSRIERAACDAGCARSRVARAASLALLLVAFGCADEQPAGGAPKNLLLVVVDTLRADRLGSYGHARDTSPALDALASQGVLFERAISAAPWTKPAVGSILAGVYPSHHGLVRMGRKLPAAVDTLAERARRHGFATGAVVSHHLLGPRFQFEQGFDRFELVPGASHDHISSPAVNAAAIEMLGELGGQDEPFLLLVHYFDPHYSYLRHPEVGFSRKAVGRLKGRLRAPRLRAMDPTPEEVDFVREVYDEEIRFTDDAIDGLVDTLRELGLLDETLIVVTADHGEELHDRGWFGHTRSLHQELVRVPLVIRSPNAPAPARGIRIHEPVSTVALLPTLLDLLEIPYEDGSFAHASLAGIVRGDGTPPHEPVYSEVDFVPAGGEGPTLARQKAIIEGTWKLIRDERRGTERLYDLASDPAELEDVAEREPARLANLRHKLDEFADPGARVPDAPSVELTPKEIELLESLGYAVPAE